MGSIDVRQFRRLTEDHIAECMALSAEASWNQKAEDWALFLRHGIVLGLRANGGVTVATGAVLPYPDDFAWISMGTGDRAAAPPTDRHEYAGSVLRRGRAARPSVDARCDTGR